MSEDIVQVSQREFVGGKADETLAVQIDAQWPEAGDARVQPQIKLVAADQHGVGHVALHHGARRVVQLAEFLKLGKATQNSKLKVVLEQSFESVYPE